MAILKEIVSPGTAEKLCMWFWELCSCCCKPVLLGPALFLLNYVLQTLFLSSANFSLILCLNLYRKIGCGLYIRRPIHLPTLIACETVYTSKMKSLLILVTISVATAKLTGVKVDCELPGPMQTTTGPTRALPEEGNFVTRKQLGKMNLVSRIFIQVHDRAKKVLQS